MRKTVPHRHILLSMCLLVPCVLPLVAPASAAETSALSTKDSSVVLSKCVSGQLTKLADRFLKKTGQTLVITDGYRTPQTQAELICKRLVAGEDVLGKYRAEVKDLAQDLAKVWQALPLANRLETCLPALQKQIQLQVDQHKYISRHLDGMGADVRTEGLTDTEIAILTSLINETSALAIHPEPTASTGRHIHVGILSCLSDHPSPACAQTPALAKNCWIPTDAECYIWSPGVPGNAKIAWTVNGGPPCSEGKADGTGTITIPIQGGEYRYEGPVVKGQPSGAGKMFFPNGDRYEGQSQSWRPNGEGTYWYASGNRYMGSWKDGKRQGQGKTSYANGDIHEGAYLGDYADGPGTYTSKSNTVSGTFDHGCLAGKNKCTWVGPVAGEAACAAKCR